MAHANHDRSNQIIWHDGCEECTERSKNLPLSLGDLDDVNRIKAWHYMRAWRWSGGDWTADARVPSMNDRRLYDCLYNIAVFLERAGFPPEEIENRMCLTLEEQRLRAHSMGLDTGIRPMTELFGINITGIFVS